MKFCKNCGATLPDGAKFCPRCGEPVNNASTVPEPLNDRPVVNEVIASKSAGEMLVSSWSPSAKKTKSLKAETSRNSTVKPPKKGWRLFDYKLLLLIILLSLYLFGTIT